MKIGRPLLALGLLAVLLALPAVAQVPMSTLVGKAEQDGAPLPGVTVTVKSPALQGTRTAVTRVNGDYILPQLLPGDYTVTFAISGFETVRKTVKLSAAQTTTVDAAMRLSGVSSSTEVVAQKETISETQQAATTVTQSTIEKLPVARNFTSAVALAPNTGTNGPNGAITIAGAMSFENLFMVNGVVVNENVRGQPLTQLSIEDSIQETTTATAGISAEYGRFQGGVVNVITKSGGNEFSGSVRATLSNDNWRAYSGYRTSTGAVAENLVDKITPTWEATFGGPILKDKIWFFLAGRYTKPETNATTSAPVSLPYVVTTDQKRYEGKVTFTPFQGHSLLLSYLKVDQKDLNNSFNPIYDQASLYDRETPQQLFSGNYSATILDNLFGEIQYSQRKFTFIGSGSRYQDLTFGTLLLDRGNGNTRWWSPTFCGVCDDETRDNQDILVKGTWYLSTKSLGSHSVVFGYDHYQDKRFANNHQSGSDYRIYGSSIIIRDGVIYPSWNASATGNSPSFIRWTPILQGSQGNDFVTDSIFVNDSWAVNSRLSLNLGVRWDKNGGSNASGFTTADDSRFSPRLGITYDVKGNGDLVASAYYARYVALLQNTQADSSAAGGQPGLVDYDYRGPAINADPNAPTSSLISTAQAVNQVFAWFFANGGTGRAIRPNTGTTIPGLNPSIQGSLDTPYTDEFAGSLTKRLGQRGMARIDAVYRKAAAFYGSLTDMTTGQVTGTMESVKLTLDRQLTVNTDAVERKYVGVSLNLSFRPNARLSLAGNYTWSQLTGNVEGETGPNGSVTTDVIAYPEYHQNSWYAPNGYLLGDRRHKVRLWGIWDVPTGLSWMNLSASVLYSYDSGTPYGGVTSVDSRAYVQNPGYVGPPTASTYWVTSRDAFRYSGVQSTDLGFMFSFHAWKSVELYIEPQVVNVFNNQAILAVNQTIQSTAAGNSGYNTWNPFTEVPIRGAAGTPGANWNYGPNFGNPTGPTSYQTPRTFRVSAGIRF